MDLYEHQGKDLFERHGIPLAERGVAETPEDARRLAERLGGKTAVKAQVQIGGRGKGGGVVLTRSPGEAEEAARRILEGGFQGMPVTRVLVETHGEDGRDWVTVGVHENVVEASWHALVDALAYGLASVQTGADPAPAVTPSADHDLRVMIGAENDGVIMIGEG